MQHRHAVLPDPFTEIRLTALQSLRGMNYWSMRPVTRMDLAVGAYDDISSAEMDGFTDRLVNVMPGLVEHRCSIGERGGFITRLRRGTYAPHIIEHVALELQTMMGHDVGFGQTRGGDIEGEYTLAFEHRHTDVGLRSAALALDVVRHAIAGTLRDVEHSIAELSALATVPEVQPISPVVLCGITGGRARHETRIEMQRRGIPEGELVVDVAPAFILQAGLPYSRSRLGIILDAQPADVPERYRDPDRARRLVSVVSDAVVRGGTVIVPAREWELQDGARDRDCKVAVFSTTNDVSPQDRRVAHSAAWVADGTIVLDRGGLTVTGGELSEGIPIAAQVAAALAIHCLASTLDATNSGAHVSA